MSEGIEIDKTVEGLDVVSFSGAGYKRLVDGPKWTLAMINYAPNFDERNFTRLERHLATDETFVLLDGEATLAIGPDAWLVPMERLKYYNVLAGTWHHVLMKPGARILIGENSDTSRENSEYLEISKRNDSQ